MGTGSGPQELVDTFGRTHRDLRISVTDRCNFRCSYCMPAEGMAWMPRDELLTYEEIERVAAVLVGRFGFESIRITGGEPTVRAHLSVLVSKLARLGADLALTTNGATLAALAHDLADSGLGRINVSLDSLRRDRFESITRRDDLHAVITGIEAALDAGLRPVKVNMVVVRGVNDDEILDMARFGRRLGVEVRYIEFMPLDASARWSAEDVVGRDEILRTIHRAHPFLVDPATPAAGGRGSDPAETFVYADGLGRVGVIPTVTAAFCGTCDRVRLTADGKLRNCLFAIDETDLRPILRSGASHEDVDDAIADAAAASVRAKWEGHLVGQQTFIRPRRSMSQIGG